MKISKNRGFTLVEMLVVIAIIAILTGIIMTNLVGSKAKSRDAKRASDLAQIQLAIEQFFDRCGQYPSSLDTSVGGGICPDDANGSQITLGNFISVIPLDPSSGNLYDYVTNYDSDINHTIYPQPTDYVLHTTFETTNSVSAQSVTTNLPLWYTDYQGTNINAFPCDLTTNYCVRPN